MATSAAAQDVAHLGPVVAADAHDVALPGPTIRGYLS